MDQPQPFPFWVLPLFPIFFTGVWLLVTTLIASMGWTALARVYREPKGLVRAPVRRFAMASMDLRRGINPLPANYNGCVIVEVAPAGLHLRTWLLFRFRHPPLFIPWPQIERAELGRLLFFQTLTLHARGVQTRIRLQGRPAQAVEEVLRQLAAGAHQPTRF